MKLKELYGEPNSGVQPEPRNVTPETEARLPAVSICSRFLEAHIWLALDDSFNPGDGLAIFYPDELEFLKDKNSQILREIHRVKLTFGGGRVRQ